MLERSKQYFNPDGTPTLEGELLGQRLARLEASMAAIAAVAEPTGGVMVDPEARTAINAIRTAAG